MENKVILTEADVLKWLKGFVVKSLDFSEGNEPYMLSRASDLLEKVEKEMVSGYEPEISSASVSVRHGTLYDSRVHVLHVDFTDKQCKEVALNTYLTGSNKYLCDTFRESFSFSPHVVQWDDYKLNFTAKELYNMSNHNVLKEGEW
jgi:hypothetical protein